MLTSHRPCSFRTLAGPALLALLSLLGAGCTTARETRPVNSDDYDRNQPLPVTLQDVWYRPATQEIFGIPYTHWGTLTVSKDGLVFTHDKGSLTIPVYDIRGVSWFTMEGDRNNEWAVVTFLENNGEQQAGFTAANGWNYHTSNKELYSAIVVAWQAAAGR
ncbi:MAG TPA: hypothetical protein VFD43_08875 [Planctomycetota bacterium]|nr:hypothetical protein [Planctomycetota bacterium]